MNKIYKYLIGALGEISLILTFITSTTNMFGQLEVIFWPHPYLYLTIAFVLTLSWFFPLLEKEKTTTHTGNVVYVVSYPGLWWKIPLLVVQTGVYIYLLVAITNKLNEEPELPTDLSSFIPAAYYIPTQRGVTYGLNLIENFSSHISKTEGNVFYILPDPNFIMKRSNLKNGTVGKENRHHEIIEFLKKRATEKKKTEYLFWLESKSNLISMTSVYFARLVNLKYPFADYLKADAGDRDTYSYWMRTYMGQWCPQLRITVRNKNGVPITIVSVIYEVKKFEGKIKAQGSTDDLPFGAPLPSKVGVVEWRLGDNLQGERTIANGANSNIELVINPQLDSFTEGTWTGDLSIKDDTGKVHKIQTLVINTHNPNLPF